MATKPLTVLPKELGGLQPAGHYDFDQIFRFAQVCHASGLFEDVTDAAQAFVKIARGQELGIAPMASMSAFDIVRKRLFVKPTFIAAKINSCGYGRYKVLEQSVERCCIRFARKVEGVGWQDCPEVSYTYAEAKAHGLVDRSPHWKASPAHMLYQRAMGRGGAMYFPELLAGLTPPPDETPLPADRHQQNIVELFGDPPTHASMPQEGSRMPQEGTHTSPQGVQEAGTNLEAAGGQKRGTPVRRDNAAWDTLEAHRDNARLPEVLLERVGAALSPLAPATDGEAFQLAGEVLDWLNSQQDAE